MDITYFGQLAFRLRGKDVSVVTDPIPPDSPLRMPKVPAAVVTLSHHDSHGLASVLDAPKVVSGPGEYEVADVLITGVATAQRPMTGPTNTAFVVRFDDVAVCHLGQLKERLSDKQVEELGAIDVLLVPAGGGNALGPGQAAEVVAQLEPSVVVPMHYRVDGFEEELDPVEMFCREMGVKEFVTEPKLTVTRGPAGSTVKVVVLEHKAAPVQERGGG